MAAPDPLSEQDLTTAREQLTAGTPYTVWFTAAAVGVPAGGSAKVVAIDDAAVGDFIQVRPAGTRDTMFCSPNELTRTRPSRRRSAPADARSAGAASADRASTRQAGRSGPGRRPARAAESAGAPDASVSTGPPAAPASTGSTTAGGSTGAGGSRRSGGVAVQGTPDPAGETRVESPTPAGARRGRPDPTRQAGGRSAEITLTLSSSVDGEWSVEVQTGKKRTVRSTPVAPAAVAKAVRELPPAVDEAVESSLAAARQRQAERVQRLRAELDAAAEALRELGG